MTVLPDLTIFTEGDRARGLGHLGRCIGYAQWWRRMDRHVLWVVDGDDAARRFLEGESVIWRRWQDDSDVPEAVERIAIADTYQTDAPAIAAISACAALAIFLDDLEMDDYPPGLVIHSAPGPLDRSNRRSQWLIGPAWQPMPSAFWDTAKRKVPTAEPAFVLVLTGGTDLRNLAGRLASLSHSALPKAHIDLTLGVGADTSGVKVAGVQIHQGVTPETLRNLMLRADVAVSAAGQTLYQLARCGTPTLMVGVAENQAKHLNRWPETGAMVTAGTWSAADLDHRIINGLEVLRPQKIRQIMSEAGQRAVDGQGCARLTEEIRRILA